MFSNHYNQFRIRFDMLFIENAKNALL